MKRCENLEKFLAVEMDVLKKHIDEYKYLRGIQNTAEAEIGFFHDYAWLMKELYCEHICECRNKCEIAEFIKAHGDLLRDK